LFSVKKRGSIITRGYMPSGGVNIKQNEESRKRLASMYFI
jgi:hypothetical protein